jgi:hypothetical protein
MNEGHPFIRQPENLSSDLMEVCCSQYFRTGGPAVDQMFYDTTKKSCTIWTGRVSILTRQAAEEISQARQERGMKQQAE